jgi:hypothetical protein
VSRISWTARQDLLDAHQDLLDALMDLLDAHQDLLDALMELDARVQPARTVSEA